MMQRAEYLREQAALLLTSNSLPSMKSTLPLNKSSIIRPVLPTPRTVSTTKRSPEPEEDSWSGGGEEEDSELAETPSPTVTVPAALMRPFKRPRKRVEIREEESLSCSEELSPPSSPSDALFNVL